MAAGDDNAGASSAVNINSGRGNTAEPEFHMPVSAPFATLPSDSRVCDGHQNSSAKSLTHSTYCSVPSASSKSSVIRQWWLASLMHARTHIII